MGLMACPECGGPVSGKAFACPHCGYRAGAEPQGPGCLGCLWAIFKIGTVLFVAWFFWLVISGAREGARRAEMRRAGGDDAAPVAPAMPVPIAEPASPPDAGPDEETPAAPSDDPTPDASSPGMDAGDDAEDLKARGIAERQRTIELRRARKARASGKAR